MLKLWNYNQIAIRWIQRRSWIECDWGSPGQLLMSSELSVLVVNWAVLAPNRTNLELFKTSFQRAKILKTDLKKSHLLWIWPNICQNLTSWPARCEWDNQSFCKHLINQPMDKKLRLCLSALPACQRGIIPTKLMPDGRKTSKSDFREF